MSVILALSDRQLVAVKRALFKGRVEQVVFGFANWHPREVEPRLEVVGLREIRPKEFEYQSDIHIQLTHEIQADLIKQAHDRKMALVEWHSHRFVAGAQFSLSDLSGFKEFVPHILWRLPERPYLALVFEKKSFDALVWISKGDDPVALGAIRTESASYHPTNRTFNNLGKHNEL